MAEVDVAPQTVAWHSGWKTFSGIAIVVLPIVMEMFGFDVRDAFPADIARFGTEAITLAGAILAFYGRIKASSPTWFNKK